MAGDGGRGVGRASLRGVSRSGGIMRSSIVGNVAWQRGRVYKLKNGGARWSTSRSKHRGMFVGVCRCIVGSIVE